MAIPHAAPGELIDVRPLGGKLAGARSVTLIRAEHLEVFRLVLPAGKVLHEHGASGSMIVQCVEGVVEFDAVGRTQTLTAGSLLYLADGEPHTLRARQAASSLVTALLRRA